MENTPPLEKELGEIFKQFPALPHNAKEILVQIAPWLCLLGAVFGALGLLAAVGLGAVSTVSSIAITSGESVGLMWVSLAILAVMVVIYVLAFTPLRSRQMKGWNLLYYSVCESRVRHIRIIS